ncbi:probable ribonuclease 11 [Psammomys obesus]|uniref:probable ribonuclease 11 n=1 Tax=Psammomys obesus TaxID=48139 RepID=UPI002452B2EA|nr:probable ribonuclease 11 [Psammomys obesus]
MAVFLLLLGLALVLVASSESTMKGITETFPQEESQPAAKQSAGESMNSTLPNENISPSKSEDVTSAPPPKSRRSYFVIPKGNTLSNDKNCLNGLIVWRNILDVNESHQLGSNFIHGSKDVIHGGPRATVWKCGHTPSLSCRESLGLEHTGGCKVAAGRQCPRCQEHGVTSVKRILTVLTSHSLMSWLVSGSKL